MTTCLSVIEYPNGELLDDAVVSPEDMARMNEARAAFRELNAILMMHVIPALGGFEHPLAIEIESRLEMVIFRSQNFLFPHRHMGASHSPVNKRTVIEKGEQP